MAATPPPSIGAIRRDWLLAALFVLPCSARALDLQPGEVRTPQAGATAVQVFFQQISQGARFVHGVRQPGNPGLETNLGQLRVAHFYETGGLPWFAYVQAAFGSKEPKGALSGQASDSGLGDLVFSSGFWPYVNRESETYLAVLAYLITPTGHYSPNQTFNIGSNRFLPAMQIAAQTALLKNLSLTAGFDTVWYSDNNQFGPKHDSLSQNALYTGQIGLRYDFNDYFGLAGTYFITGGGETQLNGIARNDAIFLQRYQFNAIASLPTLGRIILQYGEDLKTENGYLENSRWIVRFIALF